VPREMIPGERVVDAVCRSCGWRLRASNAQGSAAKHADRYLGHVVDVQVIQNLQYIGT
jgi:hypothetical protein